MSSTGQILLGFGIPLLFAALWYGICLLVARLGGWHALAQSYAAGRGFTGSRRSRFCSIRFQPATSYGACVTIGVEDDGLWFAVMPIFRVGHPPLHIPWADLDATTSRRWIFEFVELTFARAPGVVMKMSRRTFEDAVGPLESVLPGSRNATIR